MLKVILFIALSTTSTYFTGKHIINYNDSGDHYIKADTRDILCDEIIPLDDPYGYMFAWHEYIEACDWDYWPGATRGKFDDEFYFQDNRALKYAACELSLFYPREAYYPTNDCY